MKRYRCENPNVSSVTIRLGIEETLDVVLFPGGTVELPEDNGWVQSSVRKKLLTPIADPAPTPTAAPAPKPAPAVKAQKTSA